MFARKSKRASSPLNFYFLDLRIPGFIRSIPSFPFLFSLSSSIPRFVRSLGTTIVEVQLQPRWIVKIPPYFSEERPTFRNNSSRLEILSFFFQASKCKKSFSLSRCFVERVKNFFFFFVKILNYHERVHACTCMCNANTSIFEQRVFQVQRLGAIVIYIYICVCRDDRKIGILCSFDSNKFNVAHQRRS